MYLGVILGVFLLSPNQPSIAENVKVPLPSNAPLELDLLANPTASVVTVDTISQKDISIPSLWWFQESSPNKLIANWIAYTGKNNYPRRVDLIVNEQIWTLLNELERYDFVNRLGNYVREYNYNIRVFNYQQELLATYTCNFQISPSLCNIQMSFPTQNKATTKLAN
ncbi:MAG: hypothetical protein AAF208_09745 [Cyanobacteria bacterium P01_A01_bin.45]